jgi:hypothetical protein
MFRLRRPNRHRLQAERVPAAASDTHRHRGVTSRRPHRRPAGKGDAAEGLHREAAIVVAADHAAAVIDADYAGSQVWRRWEILLRNSPASSGTTRGKELYVFLKRNV